ncbi:MAG TPA: phosphate ABC transporter permease PstA [Tepidisphaeraceae bacterium]|nr:phosphate ABC transporter permease PstA [Tepidisphaeraceae bacterium]
MAADHDLRALIARRKAADVIFGALGALSIAIGLLTLGALLFDLIRTGWPRLSWEFFTSFPSRRAGQAGILSAWVGSTLIMIVTMCTALPLGVAAGIYLEEYAPKNWFTAIIEVNIANLAGVPSIIWGLMALGLFVHSTLDLGTSIRTAGLTLGLLVLPIVIISTREAIRSIPQSIREASYACGATQWQTTWHHVIPYAMGGILTGSIIGLSRAIGETAPLITIGALSYIAYLPEGMSETPPFLTWRFWKFQWLGSGYTALPIQMFNWISRPDRRFHENAAAAGVILILMTLSMNAIAIFLRYRLRKRVQW